MTEPPHPPSDDDAALPPTSSGSAALDALSVVLFEPQDPINVGTVVRAMKNMGLTDLRLVRPGDAWDPHRALIAAPRASDVIHAARLFDSLDDALHDAVFTAAASGVAHKHRYRYARPRDLAPALLARTEEGRVALLFGREDRGLTHDELNRADVILTIPTRPDYTSLNLGQAVLLITYELFLASEAPTNPFRAPKQPFPPITHADLEALLDEARRALLAIEFLKPPADAAMLRTLRTILHRADLDQREGAILRGAFAEILRYVRRNTGSS